MKVRYILRASILILLITQAVWAANNYSTWNNPLPPDPKYLTKPVTTEGSAAGKRYLQAIHAKMSALEFLKELEQANLTQVWNFTNDDPSLYLRDELQYNYSYTSTIAYDIPIGYGRKQINDLLNLATNAIQSNELEKASHIANTILKTAYRLQDSSLLYAYLIAQHYVYQTIQFIEQNPTIVTQEIINTAALGINQTSLAKDILKEQLLIPWRQYRDDHSPTLLRFISNINYIQNLRDTLENCVEGRTLYSEWIQSANTSATRYFQPNFHQSMTEPEKILPLARELDHKLTILAQKRNLSPSH